MEERPKLRIKPIACRELGTRFAHFPLLDELGGMVEQLDGARFRRCVLGSRNFRGNRYNES